MAPQATCSWCGAAVETDDGFRAYEPAGERRAVFCRLEHIVPWAIRGAAWEPGGPPEDARQATCSWCGADALIDLRRSRGEHEVPDAFCSVAHLLEWAKAGGRYR
jgi:hypothetical protein